MGVVVAGGIQGVGVPLLFSLALCSQLNKSGGLFWSGACLSDGLCLTGPWFPLAVKVLFTAFCPERATVFGGRERLLLMPHHD